MGKTTKLKTFCFVFIITALGIINTGLVSAYFYNIAYNCKDNACIEGEAAVWQIEIFNNGRNELEFTAIELSDIRNNSQFASLKLPFYPLSDKRGDIIAVKPDKNVTVNITGKLPKANYGQMLIYYPCFTTTITDSYIIARDNVYESKFCYNQNETMQVLECASSANCENDEFCSFNNCLKLKCKECQYLKDHKCMDYECCSPEQCKFDEMCGNNTCLKLNCGFNEYILNNTCNLLKCADNEFILNERCIKLNCSFDEFASNHTCKKLNCGEHEFIKNQTCKLLNCKENEYAKNHTCRLLRCLYNETFFNHTCQPLNCWFFQDMINHGCKNNRQIIFKSSLEMIAIMAIIIFFAVDFMKFEKRHKERQNDINKSVKARPKIKTEESKKEVR